MIVNISSPDEMSKLLDYVHDHWLDSEQVAMRGDELIVPLTSRSGSRVRPGITLFDLELVVHHVSRFSMYDPDEIRYYDVNELVYLPESKQVVVTSGFNFQLSAEVESLGISLRERATV